MNSWTRSIFTGLVVLIAVKSEAQFSQGLSQEQLHRNLLKIEKSIDETKNRLRDVRDARFLPDLYFALAEFYVDQARHMYALKVAQNPKKSVDDLDFTAEKRPKFLAIETYQTLIDKFPKHSDRDKALFLKAHELRELGRVEEMVNTYQQLSREYPDSRYWSESQIVVGDFFFEDKKDIRQAFKIYGEILKKSVNPFTPLAHYKMGWCLINLNDFQKALLSFEKALEVSEKVNLQDLPELYRKTDVRREALVALVWPYSELNRDTLKKMGGQRTHPIKYLYELAPDKTSYERALDRLGKRYTLKHNFVAASRIYFELLRITTTVEARLDIIERLYVSMKNSGKEWPLRGFVDEVIETLVLVEGHESLSLAKKRKARHDFEIFVRDVATRQHQRAKELRSADDWQWAIRDYKSYLWAFGKSRSAAKIRLNLAECYFNGGDYLNAAKEYERLAVASKSKDAKRKELWDASIEAYIRGLRNQSSLSRLELAEVRYGLRDVGIAYLKMFPKEPSAPGVFFSIAQTYYDERNFEVAVKYLKSFMLRYPKDNRVGVAANLLLDTYNQREDFRGLVEEGKRILSQKRWKGQPWRDQIAQILQQAELRFVQAKTDDFTSSEYAMNLLKFARKHKGSELGDRALYDAFLSFKAKKDPRAFESGEQLIVQHTSSQYAQEVVGQLGQMALHTADFHKSALYFELFQEKYPNLPQARELLSQAAKMRELLGDFKIAARDYRKLGDSTSTARMDFLSSDWTSLLRSAPQAQGMKAAYWEGLAQYRLRGISAARSLLETAVNSAGQDGEEQEYAAHALYLLASDTFSRYRRIQLRSGREQQAVQEKAALLKDLETQLQKVIQFGNGRWIIAGLYGLGQAYKEFANFIKRSPLPKGLNAQQKQEYKRVLYEQASTYQNNANNYFKECTNNAEKFEIFTRFVRGCQTSGRIQVDEAKEVLTHHRAREAAPPSAKVLRQRLWDSPSDLGLLTQLAALYTQAKDYSMAEMILTRGLEINSEHAPTMARLGVIKLYKNELDQAKAWFQRALKINAQEALALYGLAGLYQQFKFERRFSDTLKRVRAVKPPSQFVHPYMKPVIR